MMVSRRSRRENIQRRQPQLNNNAWVWRNWIKNGFRKARDIDFTHNGYCAVAKVKTAHGDIFCLSDRSPIIVRKMRDLIVDLYKTSEDVPPIFVDRYVFERVKAVENG